MTFDAAAAIASNDNTSSEWSDSSFVGALHEYHRWDAGLYFRFEAALYDFCEKRITDEVLRNSVDRVAARVFGYTMLMFSCHFDSSDGFKVQNLTDDELRYWQERLQLIFEGFFANSMPRPDALYPVNRLVANS